MISSFYCYMKIPSETITGETHVLVGDNVQVGDTINYAYPTAEGCEYDVYDKYSGIEHCVKPPVEGAQSESGTGLKVTDDCLSMVFCPTAKVFRRSRINVQSLITGVTCLQDLYFWLDKYGCKHDTAQDVVDQYLYNRPIGFVDIIIEDDGFGNATIMDLSRKPLIFDVEENGYITMRPESGGFLRFVDDGRGNVIVGGV